jgi:L-rhamnose mutarotase
MTTLRNRALGALLGIFAAASLANVAAAADRPYTEGPVSTVNSIRTEPGMFETYMKWLSTTYKPMMEENKKAGIILDYHVYQAQPRSPEDPNLYLVVTYKDMAALDGLADKTDATLQKFIGSQEVRDQKAVERSKMRTQIGTEMIRELVLK